MNNMKKDYSIISLEQKLICTHIFTESTIVTFEGSAEGPNVITIRLSACNDSSLVRGTSNQRLRVAAIDTVRPNT